jgi:uncharacterized protein (DUF2147 family)
MRKLNISIVSLIITLPFGALAVDTPIKGVWQTQKHDGRDVRIDIADCASDANLLCGKIVWLQQPTYPSDDEEAGKPKRDRHNEDPQMQSRPLLGLSLLRDFREESPTKFVDGRIYNPEDGKDYTCELTLDDNNSLTVYGYVDILGIMPVGKTQVWKRVSSATAKTGKGEASDKAEATGKGKEDEEE